MIELDSEKLYLAVVDCIRVKEEDQEKREQALLSQTGLAFLLNSGKRKHIHFDWDIPEFAASFQINRKLYFCGGKAERENGLPWVIADFFRVGYSGKSEALQSMNIERGALSLSGLSNQLIALGGFNF